MTSPIKKRGLVRDAPVYAEERPYFGLYVY